MRPEPSVSPDSVEMGMREAWAEAAASDPRRAAWIAEAFARAGDLLVSGGDSALDMAQATLLRRFGVIDLAAAGTPDLTVMFRARPDIAATVRVLRALGRHATGEIVMLDGGLDPIAALLRGLAPNLAIVRADAFDAAMPRARGARLVLLEDAIDRPSAAALAGLAEGGDAVVIGPSIMDRAIRTGLARRLAPERVRAVGRLGLRLALARSDVAGLGAVGLDDDTAVLELCQRARAAGRRIVFHDEPDMGPAA